jgi:hypothetical protein
MIIEVNAPGVNGSIRRSNVRFPFKYAGKRFLLPGMKGLP